MRTPRDYHAQKSSALIITLCMLFLISVVVLVYFSQALLNRKISFSSAGQARALMVAMDALDVIQGNLVSEILAGSTTNTVAGQTTFIPLTNATMVPYRMAVVPGVTNLIKWSAGGSNMWSASSAYNPSVTNPVLAAAGNNNSTTSVSANGRYIDPSRWSKPDFGAYPASYAPNWVLMSRQGVVNASTAAANLATLTDNATNNANYVIGRFAFAVYDEGGLIDVTAGGYPSAVTAVAAAAKGNQGYADLTQLGLSSADVNTLATWRNWSNATSLTTYTNYLSTFAPEYGFLRVAPGDNAFVSRQDFIQFWTKNLTSGTNLLQFFTTFSREKNAPSWSPLYDASDVGGTNDGVLATNTLTTKTNIPPAPTITGAYAYRDNADLATNSGQPVYNRRLYNVRVTTPFSTNRVDGTIAVVGEPLIKTRFDLSKLSWLNYNGMNGFGTTPPGGITATDIYNYFGLTLDAGSGAWIYNHTTVSPPGGSVTQTDHIYSLGEVSNAGREPDFFELLQAGILHGSLGLLSGDPTQPTVATKGGEFYRLSQTGNGLNINNPNNITHLLRYDQNNLIDYAQEKYQIIQIGANVIDQAHNNTYPTEIVLNGEHFYGTQNLPYIMALGDTCLRPPDGISGAGIPPAVQTYNDHQTYVHRWTTISLWNPHQNATNVTVPGPTSFRVYVGTGKELPTLQGTPAGTGNQANWINGPIQRAYASPPPPTTPVATVYAQVEDFSPITGTPSWIQFYASNYAGFASPAELNYSNTTTSDPNGRISTPLGWQRAGIYMGWSWSPDCTNKVPEETNADSLLNPYYPTNSGYAINVVGSFCDEHLNYFVPITYDLQYQDTATPTVWHTYQELKGFEFNDSGKGDAYMEPNDPAWTNGMFWIGGTIIYPPGNTNTIAANANTGGKGPLANNAETFDNCLFDPRTSRLNLPSIPFSTVGAVLTNTYAYAYATLPKSTAQGPHFPNAAINNGQGFASETYMTNWVNNKSVVAADVGSYYLDRDWVLREGDGAGWTNASPLTNTAAGIANRPVVLNRPFRSVGEIGYTFRDDVWKSLNLISTNSADAGLLDIFCIGSDATNAPPPSLVAGKLNINSAPPPVLQALIAGVERDIAASSTISSANAQTLASNVAYYVTNSGPLLNIAQIPGVFPQDTNTINTLYPGNKPQREALIRAVVDSSSTRTWNLMIDVIAQSGRFKPNAASLSDFIVDGEKHYWLHVAIDRFTGQIIDEQLEPVQEW